MNEMRHWLIIYDIANPCRLAKVAKVISEYAVRVQKSVYEVNTTREVVKIIRNRVNKIIVENEDFVVYFELCEEDYQKQIKYGVGKNLKAEEEKEFYIL